MNTKDTKKEAAHHGRLMTPAAAAAYLGVVVNTLAKWRHFGHGPSYIKFGSKVFYEREVIDSWLDAHRRSSTSEAA